MGGERLKEKVLIQKRHIVKPHALSHEVSAFIYILIFLWRTLMLQLLGNCDIIKVILSPLLNICSSQGKKNSNLPDDGEKQRHKGCKGWNWRPIFQIIITIKLTTLVHHSPCLIITSSASCFTMLMTLVYGLNQTNRLTQWKTALRISLGCCWSLWCCGARV